MAFLLPVPIDPRRRYRCPGCRARIALDADPCPRCGRRLEEADRDTMRAAYRERWRRGLPSLAGLVLFVVLVALAVVSLAR